MTYQNDPNPNRRQSYPMTDDRTSYTGWIVGAVVALAVVLGIFALSGRSTDKTNTAANPPATPTTSGSATPSPQSAAPAAPAKPAPAQPAAPR